MFAIDHREVDERTTVVSVRGDLDLASAPVLKRALAERLNRGAKALVIDLGGVRFLDSTALGVLVGVHRKLAPENRLAIAGADAPVMKIFELSGVAGSFHIFPGLPAALEYVRNTRGPGISGGPALTGDVTLMLGIASTAMPFADSAEDEAERWLRLLRRHGEAGVVLASLGVSEARVEPPRDWVAADPEDAEDSGVIATVCDRARRIAVMRHAPRIATTDVLRAVMDIYGAIFDRVLKAHGGDIDELAAHLAFDPATTAGH